MTYDLSRRLYSKMIREDCDDTKRSHWTELEIRGPIRNLSPELWTFTHLTALFLNDNNLQVSVCVSPLGIGELCSSFALLCYASNAGKTLLLCIMLASWTGFCARIYMYYIYTYTCVVCVSDNDSAIVDPTQPTELRCDHLQCPILEKLNPQI